MRHILWTGIILAALTLLPQRAHADAIGKDIWLGAGASWPDYRDKAMACVRGGAGVLLARHFTLGISGQADRDHTWYFGDASVILPALGMLEPYGRFQIGRRDHAGENSMAWSAGVRLGEDTIRIFAEGYGIFEPEDNYGACFGISF